MCESKISVVLNNTKKVNSNSLFITDVLKLIEIVTLKITITVNIITIIKHNNNKHKNSTI